MTISSSTRKWEYTGDGSTTVFAYTNKIFADGDLDVYVDATLQTLDTDYTVSGEGNEGGGNVTFTTAPADSTDVVIILNLDITQGTDLPAGGPFPAESVEDMSDRLTLIDLQQQEELDRSLKLEAGQTFTSATLSGDAATRANKVMRFAADGNSVDLVEFNQIDGTVDATNVTYDSSTVQEALDDRTPRVGILSNFQNTSNYTSASFAQDDIVYLEGRASVGDGAEGFFRVHTTDKSTEVAADEVTASGGDGGIWIAFGDDLTGASGAIERLYVGRTSPAWWGAAGDNATDDTAALKAQIAHDGYLSLDAKKYLITDTLLVPSSTLGSTWSGMGRELSRLTCSGMAGKPAIKLEDTTGFMRIAMRDFQVTGDCDTAIDLSTTAELFRSEFRNLALSSAADSCFITTDSFSCSWYNVSASSDDGHCFDLGGGNSTVLINCYAQNMNLGTGKAGYRIRNQALLLGCNGLDDGDLWGEFGSESATHGVDKQFLINIQGGNLENFDVAAIKLWFTGDITIGGASIVKASGTYDTVIDARNASTPKLIINGNRVSIGGGTRTASSNVVTDRKVEQFISSDGSFQNYYAETDAVLYDSQFIKGKAFGFGEWGSEYGFITCERNFGFNLQDVVTLDDNEKTPDVAGQTKIKTANTTFTNLDEALNGEEGQELYILIGDSNTDIRHDIAGTDSFINTSGSTISTSLGDVYHYVYNEGKWRQI